MSDHTARTEEDDVAPRSEEQAEERRRPYEPPRLLKKRDIARVTLFSGGSGSVVST